MVAGQSAMWELARNQPAGWLTQDEQSRLDSLSRSGRRQEFLACRYALRHLLAWAGGMPIEHWQLDAKQGKTPQLNVDHHGADAAAAFNLSLSHSDLFLACAVASKPVGIDLEVLNPVTHRINVLTLAEMACSAREIDYLKSINCESLQRQQFLRCWSLKEAYFKFMGSGVDFSTIRLLECRPLIESGFHVLAYAKSWQGITDQGQEIFLAICTKESIPESQLTVGSDIAWHQECDWSLIGLSSDK
ncbi:hypothetical protein B2J86_07840 [Acidovorax sp. SRB_14]|nr:hypothetical protein [Acidovorax sp. SRB_14]